MEHVIAAKFDPPVWMGNQIRRDALLKRLDGVLAHRLTLVHGPAGYGKTSLLAQWRATLPTTGVCVAWLALEQDDRDIERFVSYLALAVQRASGGGDEQGVSRNLPSRAALSAIVNAIGATEKTFVLVLDDVHYADSEPVLDFLKALIRMAPANCRFVFASRGNPWLGQSVLAAEDQLLEITADQLKFSDAEAKTLLHRADQSLASDEIARIIDQTEGWPIALQLTSLSLKRGEGAKNVNPAPVSGSELARYLSEQVLTRLPGEVRQVVMRAALLDRLSGDLVNLLCGRKDGWLILERLEEQGVFLTPTAPERREYRFHQLFAQYVRDHFERSYPGEFIGTHRQAAKWFAAQGMTDQAVSHAILANDDAVLADIMEAAGGWRLIPQGHQSLVARGLTKLSQESIEMRPRLALAQVYLKMKLGDLGAARAAFDAFSERERTARLSADIRTEVRVVGDTLADYQNQPVTLDDLLEREALLRKLPASDNLVLANISETLGAKYYEGGWLERALQPTLVAREHYRALGSLYSDVFTRFLEARIKRAQGRVKDARDILARTREQIAANFGDRSDLAANCAAFEAELLYERDRAEEARQLLDWALPHMEQSDGWVDVYAAAYFTEARALAAGGAFEEALEVIARGRRLAARRRLRQLELLADICEAELKVAQAGDGEEARLAAEAANVDALADTMKEQSPLYRPVALAASLCRIRVRLLQGDAEAALGELTQLRRWADQRGAGRLLIDINILTAFALRCLERLDESRASFDEAVGIAMFQDVIVPFLDAGQFVEPCLEDVLSSAAPIDKYRDQFLKMLEKGLSARRSRVCVQGLFSEAEAAVMLHLSQGRSNKEIARLIGMSTDTVKYRLKAVFRKLGVSNRRDAVRLCAERGSIPDLIPR